MRAANRTAPPAILDFDLPRLCQLDPVSEAVAFALDMAVWCRRVAKDCRAVGDDEAAAAWDGSELGYRFRANEIRADANGGRVPPGGWP